MKATKAGKVIGQAMTGYEGEDIGTVTAFVETAYFTGKSLIDQPPKNSTFNIQGLEPQTADSHEPNEYGMLGCSRRSGSAFDAGCL